MTYPATTCRNQKKTPHESDSHQNSKLKTRKIDTDRPETRTDSRIIQDRVASLSFLHANAFVEVDAVCSGVLSLRCQTGPADSGHRLRLIGDRVVRNLRAPPGHPWSGGAFSSPQTPFAVQQRLRKYRFLTQSR